MFSPRKAFERIVIGCFFAYSLIRAIRCNSSRVAVGCTALSFGTTPYRDREFSAVNMPNMKFSSPAQHEEKLSSPVLYLVIPLLHDDEGAHRPETTNIPDTPYDVVSQEELMVSQVSMLSVRLQQGAPPQNVAAHQDSPSIWVKLGGSRLEAVQNFTNKARERQPQPSRKYAGKDSNMQGKNLGVDGPFLWPRYLKNHHVRDMVCGNQQ